jgi:hypothetical protein
MSTGIFTKKQENPIETPDRVIIYKGELEYISRCILDYPDIETGGNFFGFYTTFRIPVIQYVLGPGKHSEHDPTHFKQDEAFFNVNADTLIKEHALHHIGTWHSHHKLGIDHPSGGDVNSISNGMKRDGLESFLLVIGNIDKAGTYANPYYFSLPNRNYRPVHWVVLDGESPIRQQFDKKHKDIIHVPHAGNAMMHRIESFPLYGDAAKKVSYSKGYWLNNEANKAELKIIISYLKKSYKKVSLYFQEDDQTLKISIEDLDNCEIVFPNGFPKVPPLVHCNDKVLADSGWKKSGTIAQRFVEYFEGRNRHDR